jgi:hypothetical protein
VWSGSFVCVPVIFHDNSQRASRCCWYQRVVLCWFGSLTAGTVGIGELCPPLQLPSPPFAAATHLAEAFLSAIMAPVAGEAPRSGDAWRSPALLCCGSRRSGVSLWTGSRPTSTRARPVGWRQNCGTGRWLSTALIDDLLDERFAANREQVTQSRLTDDPLRERTGAPPPSCQTNGYGYTTRYTTRCTHLSAPKRTARSLRPTRQELKTSRLGGYLNVRASIATQRGWRGSQLNPVGRPKGQSVVEGELFRAYRRHSARRANRHNGHRGVVEMICC